MAGTGASDPKDSLESEPVQSEGRNVGAVLHRQEAQSVVQPKLASLGTWRQQLLSALIWSASLLLAICVITFWLTYIAPGDPARIILGPNAHEDSVRELHSQMGLDRPIVVQLFSFLGNLATGRWGESWISRQPVTREIADHLGPTAFLGLFASVYSMAIALLINALVFAYPAVARPLLPALRLGIALPSFVVAVAAALATTRVQFWTTHSIGAESVVVYVVPAVAVALYPACVMTTVLRDRVSEILASPFFRSARATGYSLPVLFFRVLLRNSWSSLLTAWVNQISLVVFSTIIVEYVFSFRGLGTLLARSIQEKDLPVLSGIVLLNGLFFLTVQIISTRLRTRQYSRHQGPQLTPEHVQVI